MVPDKIKLVIKGIVGFLLCFVGLGVAIGVTSDWKSLGATIGGLVFAIICIPLGIWLIRGAFISRKKLYQAQIEQKILKIAQELKWVVTPVDIVTRIDYTLREVQTLLDDMVKNGHASIDVNDQGLFYCFNKGGTGQISTSRDRELETLFSEMEEEESA